VGGWKSDENMPDVDLLITAADLPYHPESIRLTVREQGRHAASPLAGVKTISWLHSVWAVGEVQLAGHLTLSLAGDYGGLCRQAVGSAHGKRGRLRIQGTGERMNAEMPRAGRG
jgi:hypothetical protein